MQVQCSKCGHRSRKVERGYYEAKGIADAGWRSYGSALYCPKCTKIINFKHCPEVMEGVTALYCPKCTKIINRLEDKDAAIMTIMERMIDDAEQEIKILKGEYRP